MHILLLINNTKMKKALLHSYRNQFKYILIFLLIIGVYGISGCKKDKSVTPVPYKYINIQINPNSTQYLGLNTIGGFVYLLDGVGGKGLIVYRVSTDEFVALDRTCTYDPEEYLAQVEVESSGITAIDSLCSSRYILLDGSVVNGPASIPLKQYNTNYDGNLLHIFN